MPADLDMSPEDAAAIAAETVSATKYYYYHDAQRKARARDTLRHMTRAFAFREDDGLADVVIEQIWNQLVGNYNDAPLHFTPDALNDT